MPAVVAAGEWAAAEEVPDGVLCHVGRERTRDLARSWLVAPGQVETKIKEVGKEPWTGDY